MYLIIGIWGGPNRIYAAFKFFLYTLLGSLLTLVAIIYLYNAAGGSFDILTWHRLPLGKLPQTLVFFAFLRGIRCQSAHVPGARLAARCPRGSATVARPYWRPSCSSWGRMALRFSMPIAPDAAREWAWLIITLSLIAVLCVGVVALVQKDMKKLVAYSFGSAHGFCHPGFLRVRRHRCLWRYCADQFPRFCLGRDVPVHWRVV